MTFDLAVLHREVFHKSRIKKSKTLSCVYYLIIFRAPSGWYHWSLPETMVPGVTTELATTPS